MSDDDAPRGELMLRTLAMPADTNPAGDIFGGWVLAQMDIAGGIAAAEATHGRVATVAVDSMSFHKPVYVGDVMCCYAEPVRTGNTSITFRIQASSPQTRKRAQELHESIEQPARWRAHSGRFAANRSRSGCSS
jgi:acyl-CoA thioesterase YciA